MASLSRLALFLYKGHSCIRKAVELLGLGSDNVRVVPVDAQRRGQVFLSSTTLDGTFMLRTCIINPRTQPEDLEYLVALVRELGAQLAEGGV